MASNDNLKIATDHLIAFSIFCALPALLTVLAIWKRFSWLGRLRLATVIPLAVAGALATKLFNPIRTESWNPQYKEAGTLRTIFGIASVTQVFAAAWALIVWFLLFVLLKSSDGASAEAMVLKRKRSTSYFYLLLADLAIVGCLVAGVAVSSASFPWLLNSCSEPRYAESRVMIGIRLAAGDVSRDAACRRGAMIQVMGMASAVLIALQDVLMFPLINLPTSLRFAVFFAIRFVRRPGLKRRDIELGETSYAPHKSSKSLEDEVMSLVAKHPHYSDLLSVFQESKGVASSEHIEVLAEKCCGKSKRQCWACDGVVCNGCMVNRSSIPVPRTTAHITGCYAICTACYLVKGTSQPAKFSATFNPTDLSLQHHGCSNSNPTAVGKMVELCLGCSSRSPEENCADREEREQRMLAKTLMRRVLCSKCEKPIPKQKRRWWICGAGDHECHWAGHEVSR